MRALLAIMTVYVTHMPLTCRQDGKSRISHELKEHGYVHEGEPSSATLPGASNDDGKDDEDDMYNYQCNLMDHGMLYLNFTDAIAEGDGDVTE